MIEEISFCDKSHRNKIVNDQRDSLKLKKKNRNDREGEYFMFRT